MRSFSSKICPLVYFTMKLARISCPIAFQAICKIILLDSFLKISLLRRCFRRRSETSDETKFIFTSCFLLSHFLLVPKNSETSRQTAVPTRKAVSKRHAWLWDAGWLAACLNLASCFCLIRASKPIVDRLTWPLPTIRLDSLLAWRSRARTRGSILESSGSWAQLCRK